MVESARTDDEEIREALGKARIRDWVERLPDGLDTMVGEEGTQLSGGERQRIVLARALLADSPVLILDEPTSTPGLSHGLGTGTRRPECGRRPLSPPRHPPAGRPRPR